MTKWMLIAILFCSTIVRANDYQQAAEIALEALGKPIQNTKLVDLKRQEKSFEQLKGQYTVVYFFASWCTPCFKTLENIEKVRKEEAIKVRVLSVALDKNPQAVRRMLDKTGYKGEAWIAPVGKLALKERLFANAWGSLPYVIKLDPNNVIIEHSYNIDLAGQWRVLLAENLSLEQAVIKGVGG